MIIRPLDATDHDGWRPLWRGYLEFYDEQPDTMPLQDTWQRLLRNESIHGLCAEVDGRLVGITHYLFHSDSWSPQAKCYLQDLFTAPAARGKGVGRALIAGVNQAARAQGASTVYWITGNDNVTARGLYDQVATLSPFVRYTQSLD